MQTINACTMASNEMVGLIVPEDEKKEIEPFSIDER